MLQVVALVVIGLVVVVLALAAAKPDTFRVARSAEVDAAPEIVFSLIDDFHRWTAWSPFEQLDPELKRTYSGAERGLGAVYAYASPKAGAGRLEITESSQPTRLVIQTDFLKPFAGHNVTEFTLEPTSAGTRVTWAMTGPLSFLSKIVNVFVNPESFLGPSYEKGLAALKALAEQEARGTQAP